MSELVSVILPTFSRNYSGFLDRAIRSVLAQNYRNFELIIADDGSVDGSRELIERYKQADGRVKSVRMDKNVGLPAYTTGMAYLQSKGQFIAFVFDDCILRPNHLSALVHKMRVEPGAGMVYGQILFHRDDGSEQVFGSPYQAELMRNGQNQIPNACVMIRRHVIGHVGWYDPHVLMKRCCDWDLWIRIADRYPTGFIQEVLAEEFGMKLADSLGKSMTLYRNLVNKYVKSNRNVTLLPKNLHKYDPFRTNIGFKLDTGEERQLEFANLEHWVKSLNIPKLIEYAQSREHMVGPEGSLRWKKIHAKNSGENISLQLLLSSMADYAERKSNQLTNELNKVSLAALKQQQYIDYQQQFINEREVYIQDLLRQLAARGG
jgi:glycosyltransferase involved in cell wall biosynthesis